MIKKTIATTALGLALIGGIVSPASAAPKDVNKDVVQDVSNQILDAYAKGTLKDGMDVKQGLKAIGDIEVPVGTNLDISMVYTKELPSVFSLCAWTTPDGSKDKATAYKSPNDSFSPMLINCNFDNSTPLTLKEDPNWAATARPAADKLNFGKMSNLNTEGTTTTTPPPASSPQSAKPEAPAAPVAQKEPANIPWGWIGFVMVGILVLAAAIGLFFFGGTMFRKGKKRRIEEKENISRWVNIMARHDDVKKEWASYELDPVKILEFPLLSDVREKTTTDFHAALRKAESLRPTNVQSVGVREANDSTYSNAVESLVNSFETARIEAKRVSWSRFSKEERSRLQRAQLLLNIAMDGNAAENERQSAYKRMVTELEGLIVMPKNTQLVIEERINLAITDGSEVNA